MVNSPITAFFRRGANSIMIGITPPPGFKLHWSGPEEELASLQCRLELPPEEILAREFEAQWNLPPGDIVVKKHPSEGQASVSSRITETIDCYHNSFWLRDTKFCLKDKRPFDLINFTDSDISKLGPITDRYSHVFGWSDNSVKGRRRMFRVIVR
jgi:hypothetical protein